MTTPILTWSAGGYGSGTSRTIYLDTIPYGTEQIPKGYEGKEEEYFQSRYPQYRTPSQATYEETKSRQEEALRKERTSREAQEEYRSEQERKKGAFMGREAQERIRREEVAKRQVESGLLTAEEVIGGKGLLESKTAQFAGRTEEEKTASRQRLYEQVIFRAPTTKPATEYIPDVKQEVAKAVIGADIRRMAGLEGVSLIPKTEQEPQSLYRPTSEEDIRYVNIGGKSVLFVKSDLVKRTTPTDILSNIEKRTSSTLISGVKGGFDYAGIDIENVLNTIDSRVQRSFSGEKPKHPLALRNVAEAVYNIEKGIVKGVTEQPVTTAISFAAGYGISKGAGVLAAKYPSLTTPLLAKSTLETRKFKTFDFGAGGVGVVESHSVIAASRVSKMYDSIAATTKPINIIGTGIGAVYAGDVAFRVSQSKTPYETLGRIAGTELIPMGLGATAKMPSISPGMKRLLASEEASIPIGGRLSHTERIKLESLSGKSGSVIVARTKHYTAASFKEPTGTGITIQSGKQSLMMIQPQALEASVKMPASKYINAQLDPSVTALKTQSVYKSKYVTETGQKGRYKEIDATLESEIVDYFAGVSLEPVVKTKSIQTTVQTTKQKQIQYPKLVSIQKQKSKLLQEQALDIEVPTAQKQKTVSITGIKTVQLQKLKMPSVQVPGMQAPQKQKTPQKPLVKLQHVQDIKIPTPTIPIISLKIPTPLKTPTRLKTPTKPPYRPEYKPPKKPPRKPPRKPPKIPLPDISIGSGIGSMKSIDADVSKSMKVKNPFITLKDI